MNAAAEASAAGLERRRATCRGAPAVDEHIYCLAVNMGEEGSTVLLGCPRLGNDCLAQGMMAADEKLVSPTEPFQVLDVGHPGKLSLLSSVALPAG